MWGYSVLMGRRSRKSQFAGRERDGGRKGDKGMEKEKEREKNGQENQR